MRGIGSTDFLAEIRTACSCTRHRTDAGQHTIYCSAEEIPEGNQLLHQRWYAHGLSGSGIVWVVRTKMIRAMKRMSGKLAVPTSAHTVEMNEVFLPLHFVWRAPLPYTFLI